MKTLKIDVDKCNYGRDCGHECESACASKVFKHNDPLRAALHIRLLENGECRAIVCDQCGDCVVVCPADALKRNKKGIVLLDKKLCVGCYTCVGFCEKNVFERNPEWLEPYKCIACGICLKACPKAALEIAEVPAPSPRII
ncbi:MAG: 4Fe-4S binding protein [Holophagales bacterium]|jgi:Fe-S-cluster-containing hydrogenase component 2|nr:4Fe-4S binding protein [Holophagales bacterium]